MRIKRSFDPSESIMKIINDLGLEEYARVSMIGRMVKVELAYDPLDRERRYLQSLRGMLRDSYNSHDSIGKHLIEQIEYFLDKIDRISLDRSLFVVPSSDGIRRLENQLAFLRREVEERGRKAREMKKLVRSMSSYIREYLRNMEKTR